MYFALTSLQHPSDPNTSRLYLHFTPEGNEMCDQSGFDLTEIHLLLCWV